MVVVYEHCSKLVWSNKNDVSYLLGYAAAGSRICLVKILEEIGTTTRPKSLTRMHDTKMDECVGHLIERSIVQQSCDKCMKDDPAKQPSASEVLDSVERLLERLGLMDKRIC